MGYYVGAEAGVLQIAPVNEQVETLVHEIGHVFGLRHIFALISETEWPAEIFGKQVKFSIMNYGGDIKRHLLTSLT